MAASDSLGLVLAQAINPLDPEMDFDAVQRLCQQILLGGDAPQRVLKIIAHKIQSPQEREALRALEVLETCVSRCGGKLSKEVGKFRFLNEMIRVVSPKYLGQRSPKSVKRRLVAILHKWSVALPQETKIVDAYQTLKRQGVIEEEPESNLPEPAGSGRALPREERVFTDERKENELKRLLASKNPEDLQAANCLIKSMVAEADRKTGLRARKRSELEEATNSCVVFSDLLRNFSNAETKSLDERELLGQMFTNCDRLRPKLFGLAAELSLIEDFVSVQEVLQQNDRLTAAINDYKERVGPLLENAATPRNATEAVLPPSDRSSGLLIAEGTDFADLDPLSAPGTGRERISIDNVSLLEPLPSATSVARTPAVATLISIDAPPESGPLSLMDLDIEPLERVARPNGPSAQRSSSEAFEASVSSASQTASIRPAHRAYSPFEGLDAIMTERILSEKSSADTPSNGAALTAGKLDLAQVADIALASVFASAQPPVVLSCRDDVTTILSVTDNRPVAGVLVLLVTSTTRNSAAAVKDFVCEISVQGGQSRAQVPSGDQLPAFSAYLPSTAISQIFLLEETSDQVSFSISYTLAPISGGAKAEAVAISGRKTIQSVVGPLPTREFD